MSATFRRPLDRSRAHAAAPRPHEPEEGQGGRLAWWGGIGALAAIGLAATLLLPWPRAESGPQTAPRASGGSSLLQAATLLGPRPPEPATLGGMERALALLDRDLANWQRLVAPEGRVDLGALRESAAQFTRISSVLPQAAAEPEARPEARPDPGSDPGSVALVALAVTLAAATLLAGLGALLLERMVLAPFRALRAVAAAMAEGHLGTEVPGTARDDEAGALARSLERFRLQALALRTEAERDPACLAEAGLRMAAAGRQLERLSASAAALALEATLRPPTGGLPPAERVVAQGVRELALQVVELREAADRSVQTIARMVEVLEPPSGSAPGSAPDSSPGAVAGRQPESRHLTGAGMR